MKVVASPHEVGTWFALPMPTGGWALGLVARRKFGKIRKGRAIFCYFFGPRVDDASDFQPPIRRSPDDRVLFARTGDEALRNGRWIVTDQIVPFSKDDWPMPKFRRGPGMGGGPNWMKRAILSRYDDDLEAVYDVEEVLIDDKSAYPKDSDYGYIAMEHAVERALRGEID